MLLTIVPDKTPDTDDALDLAMMLVQSGLLQEVRPAVAMGDSIEVMLEDKNKSEVVELFRAAGYQVVEVQ